MKKENDDENRDCVVRRRKRNFRQRITFDFNLLTFKEKFRIYPETAEFILQAIAVSPHYYKSTIDMCMLLLGIEY